MPLNPSGAISLAGPVAGQSIAVELGQSATATISLNDTNVRTLAQKPSGVIVMPTDFWGKSNITGTQRALFGWGRANVSPIASSRATGNRINYVSSAGVVASDSPGVGTSRFSLAATGYGGDKAIFGYGLSSANISITNLVSNTGVVGSDTPGVGTARRGLAAAGYGGDKAIFGYGYSTNFLSITNLVSNTGVVASDTPGLPLGRELPIGVSYGGDKAIFGYGAISSPAPTAPPLQTINYVSNTGVVGSDTVTVSTFYSSGAAASYGGDKAIFGYGVYAPLYDAASTTNLISSTGVVASNTPGVGTARQQPAAAGYGGDKAIFGYGSTNGSPSGSVSTTNLVSNTGVVSSDTPGVGMQRFALAAAGYSLTA